MSERIKRVIATGVLYYKLAAVEFLLLCGMTFCAAFAGTFEGMTEAKWQELGKFGQAVKVILVAGAVLATAKGYTSDTLGRLKREQETRDGADVRTH